MFIIQESHEPLQKSNRNKDETEIYLKFHTKSVVGYQLNFTLIFADVESLFSIKSKMKLRNTCKIVSVQE